MDSSNPLKQINYKMDKNHQIVFCSETQIENKKNKKKETKICLSEIETETKIDRYLDVKELTAKEIQRANELIECIKLFRQKKRAEGITSFVELNLGSLTDWKQDGILFKNKKKFASRQTLKLQVVRNDEDQSIIYEYRVRENEIPQLIVSQDLISVINRDKKIEENTDKRIKENTDEDFSFWIIDKGTNHQELFTEDSFMDNVTLQNNEQMLLTNIDNVTSQNNEQMLLTNEPEIKTPITPITIPPRTPITTNKQAGKTNSPVLSTNSFGFFNQDNVTSFAVNNHLASASNTGFDELSAVLQLWNKRSLTKK